MDYAQRITACPSGFKPLTTNKTPEKRFGSSVWGFEDQPAVSGKNLSLHTDVFGRENKGRIYEPRTENVNNAVLTKWKEFSKTNRSFWLGIKYNERNRG